MKLALITDLHFGTKKSDKVFLQNQINFYKNEFIPYLKENNIENIVILGDLFENRNFVHVHVMSEIFKLFEEFEKNDLFIYVIIGNHDINLRNSLEIHSLDFLKKFKNVKLFEDVELLEIENRKLLFVPWQTDIELFKKKIANKNIHCDVCFGHFDINGFYFNKKSVCNNGIDFKTFISNYTLTFSGHFHKRQVYNLKNNSVVMVGSPYQLKRGDDKGDERGFCVLNLEDLSYEFVNGKNTLKYIDLKFPEEFDEDLIKGNDIEVYVEYDGKFVENDLKIYMEGIEKFNPAFPPTKVVTNKLFENVEENIQVKTIEDLFAEYIDTLEIENKEEITQIVNEYYKESKSIN